jgi:hypothetical protein
VRRDYDESNHAGASFIAIAYSAAHGVQDTAAAPSLAPASGPSLARPIAAAPAPFGIISSPTYSDDGEASGPSLAPSNRKGGKKLGAGPIAEIAIGGFYGFCVVYTLCVLAYDTIRSLNVSLDTAQSPGKSAVRLCLSDIQDTLSAACLDNV